MGYIDFYSRTGGRAWELYELSDKGYKRVGASRIINEFIRLERPPGTHTFRVILLRKAPEYLATPEPSPYASERAIVAIKVEKQMITPVRVLSEENGRSPDGSVPMYTFSLDAKPATPFKRKKEMPYYAPVPFF